MIFDHKNGFRLTSNTLFLMLMSNTTVAYCSFWPCCGPSRSGRRSDPDRPRRVLSRRIDQRQLQGPTCCTVALHFFFFLLFPPVCFFLHPLPPSFALWLFWVSASQSTTQEPPALVTCRPTGLSPHSTAGRKADPVWLLLIYMHTWTPTRIDTGNRKILNLQLSFFSFLFLF